MTDYILLNFADPDGRAVPAIKVGDEVVPLDRGVDKGASGPLGFPLTSMKDIFQHWETAAPVLSALAADFAVSAYRPETMRPLSSVRLLAPLLYPDAIFCDFANYTDHMKEMSGRRPPDKAKVKPFFFIKLAAHCVVGPEAEIKLPTHSQQLDWEAELAVLIGKAARNVPVEDAMAHVAGYTIMNDLSLRDHGPREDWNGRYDFLPAKSFDGAAPMGPWIVPAGQIRDVYHLALKQWVDDELLQDSTTAFMHFTIAEQIAYLSSLVTLRPGDVIATGSPAGNGRPRGIFLKSGQRLTVEIENIGQLRNVIG
jgi:2-keto-4-pentenoate hydratase/2-oxohepta-3-ene-1,7-dioic acid hydratase in catechol pathway